MAAGITTHNIGVAIDFRNSKMREMRLFGLLHNLKDDNYRYLVRLCKVYLFIILCRELSSIHEIRPLPRSGGDNLLSMLSLE